MNNYQLIMLTGSNSLVNPQVSMQVDRKGDVRMEAFYVSGCVGNWN